MGDIEDYDGRTCIVCPNHFYKFDLRTGECIKPSEQGADLEEVTDWVESSEDWVNVGVRQRSHKAWQADEYDAGGRVTGSSIFVEVDLSGPEVESDEFAEVKRGQEGHWGAAELSCSEEEADDGEEGVDFEAVEAKPFDHVPASVTVDDID
eukprot:gnl/TRDRNA2_/TRDRNA2_87919_c0_seq1.p1 gnl/TRDRNA2_/TRDRNA2_87919_c0~~gnl/TRDRNA2_/TRDRNA2_87919_c0_seq1.p1  ORF type:complete len:151 (+),score=32.34 gnl/TRDRNA2_/TRDRNA2_87919_c0_seq1:330-782(+)